MSIPAYLLMELVTISWSSSALWILVMSNLSALALEHIATHLGLGFDTIFQYFLVCADLSQGCLEWEVNPVPLCKKIKWLFA